MSCVRVTVGQEFRSMFTFHSRTFIFAAMDTTSNALSRTLNVLATHPEVQDKLRQEILNALEKSGGGFSYEELVSLPLLDAVCRETLRLYVCWLCLIFSPTPNVHTWQLPTRRASAPHVCIPSWQAPRLTQDLNFSAQKDTIVPLLTPTTGIDGREMHQIVVPKGTTVIISIINFNQDPTLWGPDSYEWKPERWLSPLPDTITEAPAPGVYSHMWVPLLCCQPHSW